MHQTNRFMLYVVNSMNSTGAVRLTFGIYQTHPVKNGVYHRWFPVFLNSTKEITQLNSEVEAIATFSGRTDE